MTQAATASLEMSTRATIALKDAAERAVAGLLLMEHDAGVERTWVQMPVLVSDAKGRCAEFVMKVWRVED